MYVIIVCNNDIFKGTYVKVNPLPLRDFRGSELCDQRPVEITLQHYMVYI